MRVALVLLLAAAPVLALEPVTIPVATDAGAQLRLSARLAPAVVEQEFKRPAGAVAGLLAALKPGEARTFGALTVIPLRADASPAAVADGTAPVWSIDKADGVQALQTAGGPRLALLGQVMRGERTQDRSLEHTMIVPPGGIDAVAYCCEQKFVAKAGERLDLTGHLVPGAARVQLALDLRSELEPLRHAGSVSRAWAPTQEKVWKEIADRHAAARTSSPYLAFLDLVPARPADLSAFAAVAPPAGTLGFAFGLGGELVAVECFGDAATAAHWAPELAASWADTGWQSPGPARPRAVRATLDEVLGDLPGLEVLLAQDSGALTLSVRSAHAQGLATVLRGTAAHVLLVGLQR